MKIAIYQMEIIAGNPGENRRKAAEWVGQVCKDNKPDLLIMPELWTTGYTLDRLEELAEDNGDQTIAFISDLAVRWQVAITAGSIAAKVDKRIYNTSFTVDKRGEIIHRYDKIHLVPMLDEHLYLEGGKKKAEVFEIDGVKIGVIICYDLRFPELIRSLALEDVQLLVIAAEWPAERERHWEILQLARAIENQMYIASCNTIGSFNGVTYCGQSMVVDPWGDIIRKGSKDSEETIVCTLDLQKVKEVRKNVPIFSSRVPHLY